MQDDLHGNALIDGDTLSEKRVYRNFLGVACCGLIEGNIAAAMFCPFMSDNSKTMSLSHT